MTAGVGRGWWEGRRMLAALLLLSLLPMIAWPLPPLTDLPGHYARYAIAHGGEHAQSWARFFSYEWRASANLGVDVPVAVLAPLLGVKLATKVVVLAIPPLTVLGGWVLAREAHGRVPPTVPLMLAIAFAQPYLFGFVNFCLSFALAMFALALWIRWGREDRALLRGLVFVPLASLVYFAHAYGWGILGIGAFAAEWVRWSHKGTGRIEAPLAAGISMWPLLLPLLHLVIWGMAYGAGEGFADERWFEFDDKAAVFAIVFRDSWRTVDMLTALAVLLVLAVVAIRREFAIRASALGLAALFFGIVFMIMPQTLFSSAYADMRMVPVMLAFAILAVDGTSLRARHRLAVAALALGLFKLGVTTITSARWGEAVEERLAVLDGIEDGARIFMLHGPTQCLSTWPLRRTTHIGGYPIAERGAFSNDQWELGRASPLQVDYPAAGAYARDPSQLTRIVPCGEVYMPLYRDTLMHFPREAFDYLWMIDAPAPEGYGEFELVERNGGAALYRIRSGSDS